VILDADLAHLWTSPFFRTLVADRVRFALPRYFTRKAQLADRSNFVISVGFLRKNAFEE
jgi:hypothetical protein